VGPAAAELLHVDVLAGDGLDDVGPVMNMWLVSSTITVKSVIAGEYTAPPAHGPMISEICGMTPELCTLRREDLAVEAEGDHALLDAGAAAVVDADDRAADLRGGPRP
jgi:hypothetical protein